VATQPNPSMIQIPTAAPPQVPGVGGGGGGASVGMNIQALFQNALQQQQQQAAQARAVEAQARQTNAMAQINLVQSGFDALGRGITEGIRERTRKRERQEDIDFKREQLQSQRETALDVAELQTAPAMKRANLAEEQFVAEKAELAQQHRIAAAKDNVLRAQTGYNMYRNEYNNSLKLIFGGGTEVGPGGEVVAGPMSGLMTGLQAASAEGNREQVAAYMNTLTLTARNMQALSEKMSTYGQDILKAQAGVVAAELGVSTEDVLNTPKGEPLRDAEGKPVFDSAQDFRLTTQATLADAIVAGAQHASDSGLAIHDTAVVTSKIRAELVRTQDILQSASKIYTKGLFHQRAADGLGRFILMGEYADTEDAVAALGRVMGEIYGSEMEQSLNNLISYVKDPQANPVTLSHYIGMNNLNGALESLTQELPSRLDYWRAGGKREEHPRGKEMTEEERAAISDVMPTEAAFEALRQDFRDAGLGAPSDAKIRQMMSSGTAVRNADKMMEILATLSAITSRTAPVLAEEATRNIVSLLAPENVEAAVEEALAKGSVGAGPEDVLLRILGPSLFDDAYAEARRNMVKELSPQLDFDLGPFGRPAFAPTTTASGIELPPLAEPGFLVAPGPTPLEQEANEAFYRMMGEREDNLLTIGGAGEEESGFNFEDAGGPYTAYQEYYIRPDERKKKKRK